LVWVIVICIGPRSLCLDSDKGVDHA